MLRLQTPKSIREDISRARSYLRRGELIRSLDAATKVLRELPTAQLIGQARFEVEVLISEYVAEFNRHPETRVFYEKQNVCQPPTMRFERGQEHDLLDRLECLLHGMHKEQERLEQERAEQLLSRKQELLDRGKSLLEQGQYPRGKGVLRRVLEGWGTEEGLMVDVALLFLEHKLYTEAADLFEETMQRFPTESRAYGGAVRCYKAMQEYENCERTYIKALKQFGAHPKTLLNMAALYKRWRKLDKAYDFARRALSADPNLQAAQKLVTELEARLF